MLIVATELHLRSFRYFFPFLVWSIRSTKQAERSAGSIKVMVSNKGWRIGLTLTAWKSKEELHAFSHSGAHKFAMTRIKKYSNRYKTVRWECDNLPDWKEAAERLSGIAFITL